MSTETNRRGLRRRPLLLIVGALLFLAVGPLLEAIDQPYWLIALTRALLLGVLAISADLAWGATGIFVLGQAVFFGVGAYASGLLAVHAGITDLLLLTLASLVVGLLAGALVAAFLFFGRRRVGDLYVGLVTLALTYVMERLANGWSLVGAADGVPGIPLATLFGAPVRPGLGFFLVAAVLMLVVLGLALVVTRSQLGLVMRAVRDDHERAEFLGYRRPVVQLVVFTGTSGLAAAAGGLYALEEGFASPSLLGVVLSTQALVYVLLGGRGTLIGPVLGVLLLEVGGQRIQETLPTAWPIVVGGLLLAVILFLPGGIAGLAKQGAGAFRRPGRTVRAEAGGDHGGA